MALSSVSYILFSISTAVVQDSAVLEPVALFVYLAPGPAIVVSLIVIALVILVVALTMWQVRRFKRGGDLEYLWFSLADYDTHSAKVSQNSASPSL
jgi:hypothetical protein